MDRLWHPRQESTGNGWLPEVFGTHGLWLKWSWSPEKSVAVIAAGERWPNGNLRPALEDLLGAGAILSYASHCGLSPEARAAVSIFRSDQENLLATLLDCASGRELIARGYKEDVVIASRLNETDVVPVLVNGAFQAMDRRHNHVLPYSQ